jgi:ParB family protein of integrating conjugative element (PFGI_1 class)
MTGKAGLRQSGTGQSARDGLRLAYLDVARIRPYEHNPRRAPNAEFDRIKASIRVDGLGQPLVVTQRPGESDYLVHAGGNTRLRILKELFAETENPRFGTVACVVRPWTREADVLLAHLRENDLRGELTFLDKALAVADAKQLLEEGGTAELTQARLAEVLTRSGYGLSQGLVSQMAYVVERLRPVLPRTLESGIGRPQVARIRALDRAARALWVERPVDTEAEYDQVFEVLCRRYDTPDWDIANLRRALEAEIAERADISIHAVSIEIDARLSGRGANAPPKRDEDSDWEISLDNDEPHSDNGVAAPVNPGPPAHTIKPPQQPDTTGSADASNTRTRADVSSSQTADEDDGNEAPNITIGAPARGDVKSLRARLWTLASRLAQRNGLGDLVRPLSGQGLGFILRDVPDPALVDQLDEDALAQVSMVWWHLAACAELTVAPLDALLPALPEESVLMRALVEQDAGLLFASVWTLDPGHTGYRLWRRLDERDWQDLLGLMDAYRTIHRIAVAGNQNLWSPP